MLGWHHCEGKPGNLVTEPVEETAEETRISDGLAEPETRPVKDSRGYFVPGNNANPYGRAGNPAKKTMITEVRRKADKSASKLADAAIETALKGNVRALAFIRDTAYGVPAQKLVIQRDDDPLMAFLAAMTGQSPASLNESTNAAIEVPYQALPPSPQPSE